MCTVEIGETHMKKDISQILDIKINCMFLSQQFSSAPKDDKRPKKKEIETLQIFHLYGNFEAFLWMILSEQKNWIYIIVVPPINIACELMILSASLIKEFCRYLR